MDDNVRIFTKFIEAQIHTSRHHTKLMIYRLIKEHNAALVSEWGIDIAVVGSGLINNKNSFKYNLNSIYDALNK